jgi:N-acetylglucosamine-6-sulfatase
MINMNKHFVWAAAVLGALSLLLAWLLFARLAASPPPVATLASAPTQSGSAQNKRPNIVFILTDDLTMNLLEFMPNVLKMAEEGVTFKNYFVTDPLCAPSRASILTGRYPHNTGVFQDHTTRLFHNDGGYEAFRDHGNESATFATALSAAGYRTALLGKYLNAGYKLTHYGKYLDGYLSEPIQPAPGWTTWFAGDPTNYSFNYTLNQDGKTVQYGDKPADYLTDVLAGEGVRFVKKAAGSPFFLEIATRAPHSPYTPAPRDANALPGVRAPRSPAFNAASDQNAPKWLRGLPPLSDSDLIKIDNGFRKRAQSVLAVDAMIGALRTAVAEVGEEDNTYFVFSSDNGFHMGEYRLAPGEKETPFDSDIQVPLIVTGPGVPAGITVEEIVENIDLCPTFTELAGMVPSTSIDGQSLVPLLHGRKIAEWRSMALIEYQQEFQHLRKSQPPTYEAIRAPTYLYVEYANGEKEYHNLTADPYELRNAFSSLSEEEKAVLHSTIAELRKCQGVQSCTAAKSSNAKK